MIANTWFAYESLHKLGEKPTWESVGRCIAESPQELVQELSNLISCGPRNTFSQLVSYDELKDTMARLSSAACMTDDPVAAGLLWAAENALGASYHDLGEMLPAEALVTAMSDRLCHMADALESRGLEASPERLASMLREVAYSTSTACPSFYMPIGLSWPRTSEQRPLTADVVDEIADHDSRFDGVYAVWVALNGTCWGVMRDEPTVTDFGRTAFPNGFCVPEAPVNRSTLSAVRSLADAIQAVCDGVDPTLDLRIAMSALGIGSPVSEGDRGEKDGD